MANGLTELRAQRRFGLVLERLDNGSVRWHDPVGDPHRGLESQGLSPTYSAPGYALSALEKYAAAGLCRELPT